MMFGTSKKLKELEEICSYYEQRLTQIQEDVSKQLSRLSFDTPNSNYITKDSAILLELKVLIQHIEKRLTKLEQEK